MRGVKSKAASLLLAVVMFFCIAVPVKASSPDVILIDSFLVNLYDSFLGRTPEDAEVTSWRDQLFNGQIDGVGAVMGFYNSAEYQEKMANMSDEQYVASLYKGILQRVVDEDGLATWTQSLSRGTSRRDLLPGLLNSDEFKNNCSNMGVNAGSYSSSGTSSAATTTNETAATTATSVSSEGAANFIKRLYTIVLGRTPADTEVDYYVQKLTSGSLSGAAAADGFFLSSEFTSKNTTNEEFVNIAYRAILDRTPPDEAGLGNWVGKLDAGTTRNSVLSGLYGSAEFKALCESYGIKAQIKSARAAAVLNSVGWDLRSAFDWSVMTYERNSEWTDPGKGSAYYASIGFSNHRGNCYVMAACFYEMAIELGYDAHQVAGQVPSRKGGLTPHSWVEIVMDGTTYVFDPDFSLVSGKSGYKIQYGQSGTWRYTDYARMN